MSCRYGILIIVNLKIIGVHNGAKIIHRAASAV